MTRPESASPVAIVTGGSRGIGREIVAALVADGWSVAFTYRDNAVAAQSVEAAHGGQARAFVMDSNDWERPDRLVREVEARIGPIDGLVNNAGARYDRLMAMTPDADWDAIIDANAGGAFRFCRAVLPGMISRRRGSIVNISSLSALTGVAGHTAYAASKASLIGMTRSLAREVGRRSIRVNAVVPGFVATDMTAGLDDAARAVLRSTECLPSGTTAADVAAVVAFLLSPKANALTAQIINVDAGEFRVTVDASGRVAAGAHGPALGPARRMLGRFHVTGVFWYRLHYWAAAHTPDWFQRVGLVFFTAAFWLSMPGIRKAVAANLEPVLGPAGRLTRWRRAYRTLFQFANCLTDRYKRMAAPARLQSAVDGEDLWRQATSGGRGALLVTAHVGPWETSAYFGAQEERRVVHIVREEEIDPRAQAFIRTLVAQGGDHTVTHYASDDPRLAIELSEALRRGELVALQGDRPRVGGRTIMTSIFGQPMPLPVGPAALARASNAPMIPVFSFREGVRSSRTVIRPAIMVARTADREADLTAAMTQLAREIEWAIRERPYQWFCFRRLWGAG